METTDNQYIPGTCNMGKQELVQRKVVLVITVIAIVLTIFLIQTLHAPHKWRLLLFIPVSGFAVNLQQILFKFCVKFGIQGVFNFGNVGKTYTVEQEEYARRDRAKAWQMILTGIAIGLAAAGCYYYMPV